MQLPGERVRHAPTPGQPSRRQPYPVAMPPARGRSVSAAPGTTVGLHLQGRYGIEVAAVSELDVGVFRVDRRGEPSWVARVFPAARAAAHLAATAGHT